MRRALEPDHDLMGEDEPPRDLVLGMPALLGIFLAVSLVCAVCFGFGYSSGHTLHPQIVHIPQPLSGDTAQNSADTSAIPPDNDAYAKPTPDAAPPVSTSSAATVPAPQQLAANPSITAPAPIQHVIATPAPGLAERPTPYHAATAPNSSPSAAVPAAAAQAAPMPSATVPAATPEAQAGAPVAGPPVMVQIAAVSRAADAESLAQALRHDGFSATVRTSLNDSFFHVQIGPFTDMNAARTMRSRLANDGYNAFIKR